MERERVPTIREALDLAAAAVKRGELSKGKSRLEWVLAREPDNVLALLWMTKCVDGPEEKLGLFRSVLEIEPGNPHALKGVEVYAKHAAASMDYTVRTPLAYLPAEGAAQRQPSALVKGGRSSSAMAPTESSRPSVPVVLGAIAGAGICVCSCLFLVSRVVSTSDGSVGTQARVLPAAEVFQVSAVDAVQNDGYVVTSSVCEVIALPTPQEFQDVGWRLAFHAFRIAGPGLSEEKVVLFASNHAAADGVGLTIAVNDAAIELGQGFPAGPDIPARITVETPGAEAALACAREAGEPATLDMNGVDPEAWRSEAIRRFGPEETFDDGSKEDYVELALMICNQTDGERATMRANLGAEYEGSFQKFMLDTFCPYQ